MIHFDELQSNGLIKLPQKKQIALWGGLPFEGETASSYGQRAILNDKTIFHEMSWCYDTLNFALEELQKRLTWAKGHNDAVLVESVIADLIVEAGIGDVHFYLEAINELQRVNKVKEKTGRNPLDPGSYPYNPDDPELVHRVDELYLPHNLKYNQIAMEKGLVLQVEYTKQNQEENVGIIQQELRRL